MRAKLTLPEAKRQHPIEAFISFPPIYFPLFFLRSAKFICKPRWLLFLHACTSIYLHEVTFEGVGVGPATLDDLRGDEGHDEEGELGCELSLDD